MSNTYIPGALLWRMTLKDAPDDEIRRPLWEFPQEARRMVLHERARRWGVPNGEDDFDPEYH